MSEQIRAGQADGVLTVSLNRPEKLNALTYEMYDEIGELVRAADQDPACRVVVLKGEGRAFSAGFDLSLQVADESPEARMSAVRGRANRTRWDIWRCTKPVVAAVHGYCLAGALELVLPTDLTIASESCEFGEPEVLFGSGAAFLMVPWLMNHKQAKSVLLLGSRFSAAEALRLGVVSEVVADEQFDQRVGAIATYLSRLPAPAVSVAKLGINRAYETAGIAAHIDGWVDSLVALSGMSDPVTDEFARRVERDGVGDALAWRKQYYEIDTKVAPSDEQ